MIIPLEKFWSVFTAKPCREQREIVAHEWPTGIPLCNETIQRALDLKLDFDWVAKYFPAPLRSEYEEKLAPLWREYNEKTAPLRREYNEKTAPIRREYEEKTALIWREYQEKRALILLEILTKVFN